jgi:3-deoxy-D-arabino-heptulosonate 7-phosphate (DAHP) synthase class II
MTSLVLASARFHTDTSTCSSSTLTSSSGLKTRNFGTIISELTSCIRIHSENGSRLGGVSLEFTGELNDEGFSVTECLGGSMGLSEEQLGLRYQVRYPFVLVQKSF